MPAKSAIGTYFAALGLGFMFLEVAVMQRLTLLLGYPTYALSVTLFALLLSAGIGSWIASRTTAGAVPQARRVLLALAGVVLAFLAGSDALIAGLAGRSLAIRIGVAVACVAPLGLCLGAFLPLGLRRIGELTDDPDAYAAWAFGVNGAFSVVASVASTMLAMTIGFRALILLALAIYVLGTVALRARAPRPAVLGPS